MKPNDKQELFEILNGTVNQKGAVWDAWMWEAILAIEDAGFSRDS